jgi:hypothetical protein
LADVADELRGKAGRAVNFMVYNSKSDAMRRAEYSAACAGIDVELLT